MNWRKREGERGDSIPEDLGGPLGPHLLEKRTRSCWEVEKKCCRLNVSHQVCMLETAPRAASENCETSKVLKSWLSALLSRLQNALLITGLASLLKQPDRQLFPLSSHQAWSLSDNLHHVCMPLPFRLELFTLQNWRQAILIHSKLTRSGLMWWLTPVISSLERLMCDNLPVFRASLGYRVSSDKPGRGLPQKTKQWQQESQVTTEFIYLICVYMNRYVCGTHVPTCVRGQFEEVAYIFWPLWLPINTEFWKWKKPVAKGHVLCD